MKITIIGTGYVGLVSGICFAKIGHDVICVDKDTAKIFKLTNGQIPIFEPGLKEALDEATKDNKIHFTTSLKDAVEESDIIFIAVGTPQEQNKGNANLDFVYEVAKEIATNATSNKVIVTKSTVPVGTGKKIQNILHQTSPDITFSIISNPEFLREGKALYDFLNPDRIVIGSHDQESKELMDQLYLPLKKLTNNPNLLIHTDVATSELIKYASNAFLATKVAFINEMANLCEKINGNIKDLSLGMGSDSRIGRQFLNPGPGFGGSCFPKDILALSSIAKQHDTNPSLVDAVITSNQNRKLDMVNKIIKSCGNDIKNKKIALLGLAFKADTDDIRYSPAIAIAQELLAAGAHIKAFDPQAIENCKNELPNNNNLTYHKDEYQAAQDADAIVIATEWSQFKQMDLKRLILLLKKPLIIDLRNILDSKEIKQAGFNYVSIG
jgi:UDPglucose 6-dehydrogenase